MAVLSWDPVIWQRASDLIQQAERIQRNFLQIAAGAHYYAGSTRVSRWVPPVSVVESDKSIWVLSALPGVSRDCLEARLEAGELVISGQGVLPACCEQGELKIWEVPLGRFERRVKLAAFDLVSIAEIRLQDGLLVIKLNKKR